MSSHLPRRRPQLGPTGIVLREVSVQLGGRDVLQEVSAAVEPGGWTTVVGANGAGKSTLLRAVMGLVDHRGTVEVGGTQTSALSARDRAGHLALVPQSPVLPPGMTVGSYVLLGRLAHMGPFARESKADLRAVGAVLDRLGVAALAPRRLTTLSGGEAQRVAIARALVQQAPVLLLDEPTSSLDIGHQLDVLDLIDTLRREAGLTVLSTMHDLTLAGQYADQVVLLADGKVAASGPPQQVLTEATLSRYYRATVRVLHDGDRLIVVPTRGTGSERPRPGDRAARREGA